jgi:hypothetical protein
MQEGGIDHMVEDIFRHVESQPNRVFFGPGQLFGNLQ